MIYLVNPSEKKILDNAGDRVPLGLLSMASNFNDKGLQTKLFDLNHYPIDEFYRSFYVDKPEAVGISVYTSPMAKDAKDLAWSLFGKTKLVAGGVHATHMPETLRNEFDLIIRGEGEEAHNVIPTQHGVVSMTPPQLSSTADIDYDLLNMDDYQMQQDGKRTGTLITSRGCYGDCAFCGKLEDKIRFEPYKKVFKQMKDLNDKGFESLYFLDDVFTANKKRMGMITSYAKKLKMPFRVTTRADLINDERLGILASNGCERLSMGIESGNADVLSKSNKGISIHQNYSAVVNAKRHGIKTKGFFILGLPGETEQTAQQTIQFSKLLKDEGMDQADFYMLTPFPGTPIWNNPEKFGIEITNKDYTRYLEAGKDAQCYVNTKHLPAKRIQELVKEAKNEWKD